jgi:hypothetical protein
MARYFFGYLDGPPELEGEELADDDEAAALAVVVGRELARNSMEGRRTVVAYDESGRRVQSNNPLMVCSRCKSEAALSGSERDSEDSKRIVYTFTCTNCGFVQSRSVRHH